MRLFLPLSLVVLALATLGACPPPDECTKDADCRGADLCARGRCVECETDSDCDDDEQCDDNSCDSLGEGEGEGESAGEGEGEAAGEGEGEAAGEGEGEATGEGEGEAAGEGEGEAAGEGEGEGEATLAERACARLLECDLAGPPCVEAMQSWLDDSAGVNDPEGICDDAHAAFAAVLECTASAPCGQAVNACATEDAALQQLQDNGAGPCFVGALPRPSSWTCDPSYWGDGETCDCGCGAPDPDCTTGCVDPSCDVPGCNFCTDGLVRQQCGGG